MSTEWNPGASSPVSLESVQTIYLQSFAAIDARVKGNPQAVPNSNVPVKAFDNIVDRIRSSSGKPIEEITLADVTEHLPPSAFFLRKLPLTELIAQYCVDYYTDALVIAQKKKLDMDDGQIVELKGEAPWKSINKILATVDIGFTIGAPKLLRTPFELLARHEHTGDEIRFQDLSSGEKAIFSLVFWLYSTERHGVHPKLMILDEPDAHLHPSLTTTLIDVLYDTFVRKHGIRVIMTTHSPETVTYAPGESIIKCSVLTHEL